MDADEALGVRVAHPGGGDAAPVAALRREALVAQRLGHQGDEDIGDLLDAEALLAGPKGEAKAGERRRHDRESVGGIAAEASGIGQARYEVHELEHRPGPTVHQQQGHRTRPVTRDVQKVEVIVGPRDPELREGVQPCFLRAPVERAAPVLDKAAKGVDARPVGPRVAGRGIGKAGAAEALAQIRKFGVRHVQGKGLRHRAPPAAIPGVYISGAFPPDNRSTCVKPPPGRRRGRSAGPPDRA